MLIIFQMNKKEEKFRCDTKSKWASERLEDGIVEKKEWQKITKRSAGRQ